METWTFKPAVPWWFNFDPWPNQHPFLPQPLNLYRSLARWTTSCGATSSTRTAQETMIERRLAFCVVEPVAGFSLTVHGLSNILTPVRWAHTPWPQYPCLVVPKGIKEKPQFGCPFWRFLCWWVLPGDQKGEGANSKDDPSHA